MITGLIKIHFKFLINTAFPRLFKQRTNYTVSKAHLLYQRIIIDFSDWAVKIYYVKTAVAAVLNKNKMLLNNPSFY